MPILAKNVVATSQPLAAQAGLYILRQGGNAMDAAVATAMALSVVEPTSNGIGSDGFALIWDGNTLHGLNASGRAPKALKPSHFAGQDSVPRRGWGGVTVPGAVSGWAAISERFGALPFEKLAEPAINYARNGFLVSPQTAYYWSRGARAYRGMDAWFETFAPGGKPPEVGELFKSEGHATTLESIGATRGESFYRGELARKIAAAAAADDGLITEADMAAHQHDWVQPISVDYRGYQLHEIPPNGQGLVALLALGILRNFEPGHVGPDDPDWLHLQIEAMKLAFADGHRYIADPEWMDRSVTELLDSAYLESRARMIDRATATDFDHGDPKSGGTVYLTTADAHGNMVSYIQSNYTGFGSGVVVPGTGIALQNRGCCFTLEEGHPNQAGGGKRPYHTIIPGFVTRGEEAIMSFGVMGGFMQPQGHAQVVARLVDHHQNPQAALDAPRWQVMSNKEILVEPGFDDAIYENLTARGHDIRIAQARTVTHGRGQCAFKLDDGYFAASDQRSDGQAVGF